MAINSGIFVETKRKKEWKMIMEFSVENTYSIKKWQTISFEAADNDDRHIITIGGKSLLKNILDTVNWEKVEK